MFKKMKFFKKTALAVAAITASACVFFSPAQKAEAGSSKEYVVSQASISGSTINKGDFFIKGDVSAKNGKAYFGKESSVSSLFSKARIVNNGKYGIPNLFDMSCKVNIKELAESGKFSVCFGMKKINSYIGAAESFELAFTSVNGKINVGLHYYDANKQKSDVYQTAEFASLQFGKDISVEISVTSNDKIDFSIEGVKYAKGQPIADASGCFAFFSENGNDVVLSEVSVIGYKYDAPETIDYLETFDDGGYNANVFSSKSEASPMNPSSLKVEDGKLTFKNAANAYFTTRYVYSNFELTFDISDLCTEAEYDENGNVTKLISTWFGIAFGVDSVDFTTDATVRNSTWLQFEGIPMSTPQRHFNHTEHYAYPRYVLYDRDMAHPKAIASMYGSQDKSFSLWDKNTVQGRTVNVKLTVTDGLVELYYRFDGDEDWGTPYFAYDLGLTRTGYVRIFTVGSTSIDSEGLKYTAIANFSIDNFRIKNTDNELARKYAETPEYKSNKRDKTKDFDYVTKPDNDDLLASKIANGKLSGGNTSGKPAGSCSGSVGAGVATAALLPVVYALIRRKKNEK